MDRPANRKIDFSEPSVDINFKKKMDRPGFEPGDSTMPM